MRLEGVHVHPVLPPGSAPATFSRSLAIRETTADRFLHDLRWQQAVQRMQGDGPK